MKKIFILIFLCISFHAEAQIRWKESSDWEIYKIPGSIIFKIRTDSLKTLNSHPLQLDSMVNFLSRSTILPDSVNPVWMGGWVATYKYMEQVHKIQISAYAGFFFDQSSGRFYQVPEELQERWMIYINQILSLF